jgi:hypothetical protein
MPGLPALGAAMIENTEAPRLHPELVSKTRNVIQIGQEVASAEGQQRGARVAP